MLWLLIALNASPYVYEATIVSAYDADTVTALVDLGFHTYREEKLRLARINAPEVRGKERPEGLRCRDLLRSRVLGKKILVQTVKDKKGKYGRYLADLWMDGENLNDWLVSEQCARYQKY